jgi:hypothetical protein
MTGGLCRVVVGGLNFDHEANGLNLSTQIFVTKGWDR